MKYDVFISYSRKDAAVADQIAKAFDAAGISYFMDRQEMEGGLESSKVHATAIKESTVFLFLASKNSYESKYTLNEIVYAFNKKEDPQIIPYIIDGSTLPDELDLTFSSFKCRDMRQLPIQTVVEDVLERIGRKTDSPIGSTTPPQTNYDSKMVSRKRRVWPWLAAVLAVALVVILSMRGCSGGAAGGKGGKESPVVVDTTYTVTYQEGSIMVNGKKCYDMKYMKGGTFTMGCTAEQGEYCYDNEKPAHQVTLSSFYMGETEVTQALWKAVMGSEPTEFDGWTSKYGRGDDYPAYRVSYDDIVKEFIPKLNRLTGKNFRLPTEAEWEYAARGGNKSKGYKYSGSNNLEDMAWYCDNSDHKTHPVRTKSANELGLYDMSGNELEWCGDWYGDYISEGQTDPKGPSTGSYRVLRGGSCCCFDARDCCVFDRNSCSSPDNRGFGFRLVMVQ